MTGAVENTVWARAFVDELARCGLREVVIAPGSRSTPLVMACSAHPRLSCRVHMDERSAGFFALGIGKATGLPAAVVTTSGTAVANLFPAVVEASQAGIPLLVLSADRPPRLRGADANQAIDQLRIFGSYPRAFHETAAASFDPRALRHHRSTACRAYAATGGSDRGPVHVNLPFDKPLEPVEVPAALAEVDSLGIAGRHDDLPFTTVESGGSRVTDAALKDALSGVDLSRAVVVAGPSAQPDREGQAVRAFAEQLGCPLLADGLSGARFGPSGSQGNGGAAAVAGYDLFLRDAGTRAALGPTTIFRIGVSPTSAGLQRWLFEHEKVTQIVIASGSRFQDHGTTADRYIDADIDDALTGLTGLIAHAQTAAAVVETSWTARWRAADEAVRRATNGEGPTHEGDVLAAAAAAVPRDGALFVSSSMPVRDLDAFVHPAEQRLRVLANRGASGIDGVVSTAFGVASQTEGPVICAIGDLAFFHDQNGLLWSREEDARVIFVLIDNDGGGIFHMLPVADHEPAFTTFFATPHGLDFSHAAAQYTMDFAEAEVADLPSTLRGCVAGGRSAVVRVRTDRGANQARRAQIATDVVRAVREAIEVV